MVHIACCTHGPASQRLFLRGVGWAPLHHHCGDGQHSLGQKGWGGRRWHLRAGQGTLTPLRRGTLSIFSSEVQPGLLLANCCRIPGQSVCLLALYSIYKNDTFQLQTVLLLSQGAGGRQDSRDVGLAEQKPPQLTPVHVQSVKLFSVIWKAWDICFLQTFWNGKILFFLCVFTSCIETYFSLKNKNQSETTLTPVILLHFWDLPLSKGIIPPDGPCGSTYCFLQRNF